MAEPRPMTDEEVFGQGQTPTYGPGAPESGQPATPEQMDWLRRNATAINHAATVGSEQRPAFDTPTVHGDDTIYHVDERGQLFDPARDAAKAAGVAPAKTMSDAEVFGQDFVPGVGYDRRPTNQAVGSGEGLFVVGKNVENVMGGHLPGSTFPTLMDLNPLNIAAKFGLGQLRGGLDTAEKTERPGQTGKFLTEALLTAPASFTPAGPLASGAVQGALTSEATTPLGRLADVGLGAVGGKVGDIIGTGASRLLNPKLSPNVQALVDAKIPLSVGQIVGGPIHRVEDGMTSLPVLGDMINNTHKRSLEGLNIAVANRALEPIGESVPVDVPAGRKSIEYAGDRLSDRYQKLLPNLTVQLDPQFTQDLGNVAANVTSAMRPEDAKLFGRFVSDNVLAKFDPRSGFMPPEAMKDAETTLGLRIKRYAASPVPADQDMADALRATQQALRDLVTRGNPQAAPDLQALNRGWANLVVGEKATGSLGAKEGLFTPSQLAGAVKASDDSVRKRGYARGDALMQDLSDPANAVLPSTVPDSGSPLRHAIEVGVGAGVAKESGMWPAVGKGLLVGSLMGLPYTKPGQAAMQYLLAGSRPVQSKQVAALIERLNPLLATAGAVGAPTLGRGAAAQAGLDLPR